MSDRDNQLVRADARFDQIVTRAVDRMHDDFAGHAATMLKIQRIVQHGEPWSPSIEEVQYLLTFAHVGSAYMAGKLLGRSVVE